MNFGNLGFGQNYVIYLDMFILNLCTYFYCFYLLNSYMRFYVRLFYVPSSPLSDIISFVELVYQVLQRHRKGKKEDTLRTGGGKGPEKHFIFMVSPSF